jgi:hypothetical protein
MVRETSTYRAATLRVVAPERDEALARLAAEEESARRALAEQIAHEAGTVTASTRTLGALDRLLARVAFSQHWGGCVPVVAADSVAFENATFAPLAETLAKRLPASCARARAPASRRRLSARRFRCSHRSSGSAAKLPTPSGCSRHMPRRSRARRTRSARRTGVR